MSGAEGLNKEIDDREKRLPECPVCLQTCLQPISLPCSHIFCFICAKGIASHSKKCALCRKKIPDGYLNSPVVVEDPTPQVAIEGKYQWFYRGTNGWWQYDPRISNEIEASYKEGEMTLKVMIAGFMYIVDVDKMVQYRENIPSRVRCIKRDLIDIPDKKGIAGLPLAKSLPKKSDPNNPEAGGLVGPNETGQTEHVSGEANELSAQLSSLSLTDNVSDISEDRDRNTKVSD